MNIPRRSLVALREKVKSLGLVGKPTKRPHTKKTGPVDGFSDPGPTVDRTELLWKCAECGQFRTRILWVPGPCAYCGAPKTRLELVYEG